MGFEVSVLTCCAWVVSHFELLLSKDGGIYLIETFPRGDPSGTEECLRSGQTGVSRHLVRSCNNHEVLSTSILSKAWLTIYHRPEEVMDSSRRKITLGS